ncbi:MAG: DNA-directed RNA polymerase subunit omega [Phycisphaeraceae bacterium]
MIPELKDDELIKRFGGRFRLTAVIQKRWRQLLQGARPMVDPEGLTELEIVIKELVEGRVEIDDTPVGEEKSESD